MQKNLLLTIVGVALASCAFAEEPRASLAVDAALDRVAQGGAAPRWKSSLGEIERSTAELVAANQKLSDEYAALNAQVAGLVASIKSQQKINGNQTADLERRRREVADGSSVERMNQRIAQANKDSQAAGAEASTAKAHLNAVDNKLALRRLKISELELEKKARLGERQARANAALAVLKQSVQLLKERVESQKKQVDFVRQKTAEMRQVDRPYLKDVQRITEENAKLKTELTALTSERDDLAKQVQAAQEKQSKVAPLTEIKRLADLLARKQNLQGRWIIAEGKKKSLTAAADAQSVSMKALTTQIANLEEENRRIQESTSNVRENVAVLEYNINTLTRYKNRKNTKK